MPADQPGRRFGMAAERLCAAASVFVTSHPIALARAFTTARPIALVHALAIALSLTACSTGDGGTPADGGLADAYGAIALETCQLATEGLSLRVPAECGALEVPENRDEPDDRSIRLAIAVRRAVVRAKSPEPVFYLAGGPGQSAIESYVALAPAFASLRRRHDIILVDQRGTGSSNPLDCPSDDEDDDALVRIDVRPETIAGQTRACLAAVEAGGADPRQYTTSQAIDDLEAVRVALGVERVNLVGVSYGTRVAQAYAARYPERTRSLVLDGVVPPDWPLGSTIAADAQGALDALLMRCAADDGCSDAFGPSDEWSPAVLRDRLEEEPITVTARHPQDGESRQVEMTPDVVAFTVRMLLYGSETASLLPLALAAADDGDFGPLAAQFMLMAGELESGISSGMSHSVTCAEDVPRLASAESLRAMSESEAGTFLADIISTSLRATCSEWPQGATDETLWRPFESDVPTLLLSGQWDPVTPSEGAKHVLTGLSQGRHLVAPGQSHGVLGRGCMSAIVADFVEAGSVDGLDAACLENLTPAPFFTSFAGPRP